MSETIPLYKRVLDGRVIGPVAMITLLSTFPFGGVVTVLCVLLINNAMDQVIVALTTSFLFMAITFIVCARVQLQSVVKKKN